MHAALAKPPWPPVDIHLSARDLDGPPRVE